MAKKKAVIKRGIFLTRNSKGIVVSIHASNGRKLAVMSGYNNVQNARKGISALLDELEAHKANMTEMPVVMKNGQYLFLLPITDLTKPVKKTAKPTKKVTGSSASSGARTRCAKRPAPSARIRPTLSIGAVRS